MIREVHVEQLNPNDSEFRVILKEFINGDVIEQGKLLFELEGQKTTFEVVSDYAGLIFTSYDIDDYISVDDPVYYIYDNSDELDELKRMLSVVESEEKHHKIERQGQMDPICGLNKLHMAGINVAVLPGGKAYRQIEDAVVGNDNINLVGYFDDDERNSKEKLGEIDFDIINSLWLDGMFDRVFVATGDSQLRTTILNSLSDIGIKTINIIHPTAYISDSATIGSNVFIGPMASIGPKSFVGDGCFLSAFSNVEHHCYLSQNILFGPGVMLSGSVKIGARTVLSSGVSVESNIVIGEDVFVGVGLGVSTHLKDSQRVIS